MQGGELFPTNEDIYDIVANLRSALTIAFEDRVHPPSGWTSDGLGELGGAVMILIDRQGKRCIFPLIGFPTKSMHWARKLLSTYTPGLNWVE